MTQRIGAFLMLALGLALSNMNRASLEPAAPKTCQQRARAKLEAARTTFETLSRNKAYPNVEIAYRWSARWLEAQRQLCETKEDRIAACQAHRQRMRELKRNTRQLFDRNVITIDQVHAVGYYVAEAELLVVQAKQYGREVHAPLP